MAASFAFVKSSMFLKCTAAVEEEDRKGDGKRWIFDQREKT